jgi:hypothetical protein
MVLGPGSPLLGDIWLGLLAGVLVAGTVSSHPPSVGV